MYTLEQLRKLSNGDDKYLIEGCWVPARPITINSISFWARLKDAWVVLMGHADAVKWPKQ